MFHDRVSAVVPASCERAFDVIHDYTQRLAWDTLLRDAFVDGGVARVGALAVCTGRRAIGGLRFETEYVSFERGVVAAVKMTNRPPFFATWAASIRHERVEAGGASRVTYTVTFAARPRMLAFALEPILGAVFRWETRRRLRALARYLG